MEIFVIFKKPIIPLVISIILAIYISTGENKIFAIFLLVLFIGILIGTRSPKKNLIIYIIAFTIFFGYSTLKINFLKHYGINNDGQNIQIEGEITAINVINRDYVSVIVKEKGLFSPKLKVKIYNYYDNIYPGMRIKGSGLFLKAKKKTNIGGYNEENYMYSNNIYGKTYIYANKCEIEKNKSIRFMLGKLYNDIKIKSIGMLGSYKGNILAGMLIGAKESIDEQTVNIFRVSGLSHTMAVSGSHVMYILIPLLFIFSKMRLRRRQYYPVIGLILILFAILTCLKPSVLRATITALILLSADYFYEQYDSLNSLSLSAIILLILNPLYIFDAGFILSYSCVAAILILYNPLLSLFKNNKYIGALILSLSVQLGIIFISAKIFYTFYTFSLLVNIIVLPIRMVLTILGWLMYFFTLFLKPIATILAIVVSTMLDYILITAKFFSQFNISSISLKYISPIVILIYYVTLVLFLYSKKKKIVLVGILLIVLSISIPKIFSPKLNIVFFDVGQGDCSLIQIKHYDILIDCGQYAPTNSISNYTGDIIDYIFITHSHIDHLGGIYSIINRFNVKCVILPDVIDKGFDDLVKLCKKKNIEVIRTDFSDVYNIDKLRITILNPTKSKYDIINNTSIVFIAHYDKLNMLFTGDCEKQIEDNILKKDINISCDILKVAHHGSDTSTTTAFYEKVQPKIAIISVGYNKYGHPSQKTLEKLKRYYRTDIFGAIIIQYKRDMLFVETGIK